MAMNTSIYGEQYPDGYDWNKNPLGLRDPRGSWVGADDPSRALDMSSTDLPSGPKAGTMQSMLDRYNQPGGWWGASGPSSASPGGVSAKSTPKRTAAGVASVAASPASTTSGSASPQPTGNMFLDGRGQGGPINSTRGYGGAAASPPRVGAPVTPIAPPIGRRYGVPDPGGDSGQTNVRSWVDPVTGKRMVSYTDPNTGQVYTQEDTLDSFLGQPQVGGGARGGGAMPPARGAGGRVSGGGGAAGGGTGTPWDDFFSPAGINARGGGASTSNAGDLTEYLDPGYNFRLAEGIKALQSGAAAGGNFLSGQTLKDLMGYGQSMASQEYANAYNRMASDRNYATDLEKWNKTFGRDTSQMDWTNDTMTLQMLLNAGLAGVGGSSRVQELLATLLAQAAISKGQIGAGGHIANSNVVNDLITNFLNRGRP